MIYYAYLHQLCREYQIYLLLSRNCLLDQQQPHPDLHFLQKIKINYFELFQRISYITLGARVSCTKGEIGEGQVYVIFPSCFYTFSLLYFQGSGTQGIFISMAPIIIVNFWKPKGTIQVF